MIRPFLANQGRRAFTLVELLVAMAVSALLVLALVNMLGNTSHLVSYTNDRLNALNDAQAALDLIARDLQAIPLNNLTFSPVPIAGTSPAAAGTTTSTECLQARQVPNGINLTGTQTSTQNCMELMLLTSSSEDASSSSEAGVVHAVCYRLAWQDPSVQTNTTNYKNFMLGLYRSSDSGQNTYTNGLSKGLTDLSAYQGTNWNLSSSSSPKLSDLLVSNAVDLEIAAYDVNPSNSPAAKLLNSPVSSTSTSTVLAPIRLSTSGLLINGSSQFYTNLWCEVRLTVLNQTGATLFNSGGISLSNAILKYGHTFATRVQLVGP